MKTLHFRVFKRQTGWPESVKNDLTGHFHRFMASLVEMSNQVKKAWETTRLCMRSKFSRVKRYVGWVIRRSPGVGGLRCRAAPVAPTKVNAKQKRTETSRGAQGAAGDAPRSSTNLLFDSTARWRGCSTWRRACPSQISWPSRCSVDHTIGKHARSDCVQDARTFHAHHTCVLLGKQAETVAASIPTVFGASDV